MEAEMKVLKGVMEARLCHIGFALSATLQTLMATSSVFCKTIRRLNRKEKKTSSKLSKRPKYRRKYSLLLPQLLLLLPRLLLPRLLLLLLLPRLPHQIFLMKKIVSQIIVSKTMMIFLP
jgi:hypothetical protein